MECEWKHGVPWAVVHLRGGSRGWPRLGGWTSHQLVQKDPDALVSLCRASDGLIAHGANTPDFQPFHEAPTAQRGDAQREGKSHHHHQYSGQPSLNLSRQANWLEPHPNPNRRPLQLTVGQEDLPYLDAGSPMGQLRPAPAK